MWEMENFRKIVLVNLCEDVEEKEQEMSNKYFYTIYQYSSNCENDKKRDWMRNGIKWKLKSIWIAVNSLTKSFMFCWW